MVMDSNRNVPSSQSPSQSQSSLQPSEQKISTNKEETKHDVADIKEVLAESLITYNIKMALSERADAKNKSSDFGENDDDLAFLLDKSIT